MTPHSGPSVFRRGRSFPDGPGGFGHVPRHPNMHCVLPKWRCVHGKGSGALSKHKGQSVCFVELIRPSPRWCMRNNITIFSLLLPLGHLFHPHQQTRHRSHLFPWWEIWSGHGQGNYYPEICDLKVFVFVVVSKPKKARAWVSVFDQVVHQSDKDIVTVIGAGVTLHEALAAADILASEGAFMSPSSGEIYPFQGLTIVLISCAYKLKVNSYSLKVCLLLSI